MEISVKEFKKALEIVKPGVAATEVTIEQVTSFAFTNKNVISYNDEICITHPLADFDAQGAIKADELYKFISKVKTKQIMLEIDEDEITMKYGRTKATFVLDSKIKLPLDDAALITKGKWKVLPEKFIEALTMAKNCTSKDMIRPKLTCVHINKSGFIESSDGYRIFRFNFDGKLPLKTVLIPATSINVILKINPTKVAKGEDWAHFKNEEGTVLSCRILNDTFPSVSEYLSDGKNGVKVEFPKELLESLDTAEMFAEDGSVTIAINKKKITVTSQSQVASFSEELEFSKKAEPFAFQVAPYLLRDMLKKTQSCTIYPDKLIFKDSDWVFMTELSIVEN